MFNRSEWRIYSSILTFQPNILKKKLFFFTSNLLLSNLAIRYILQILFLRRKKSRMNIYTFQQKEKSG